MKSLAAAHFPLLFYHRQKVWLYNPVLRKRFANRPEERVRLRWVEFLLHQTNWPKSRIGFEAPIRLHRGGKNLRADLVLYNREMKPQILVECKAESVALTPAVAEQAARYNSKIQAPFLVLTNGVQDFWFENRNGKIQPAEPPFKQTKPLEAVYDSPDYWAERGFCTSDPVHESNLQTALSFFWSDEISWPVRYLDFQKSFLPFAMSHYYRIAGVDDQTKIAIGFLGEKESGNFLAGILNKSGANTGVVVIDLDNVHKSQEPAVTVFTGSGPAHLNPDKILPEQFLKFDPETIKNLPLFLMRFFD